MKANEFVKKYGWDVTMDCINFAKGDEHGMAYYKDMGLYELIESRNLVVKLGGLKSLKRKIKLLKFANLIGFKFSLFGLSFEQIHSVEKAITDVESCHVD